MKPFRSLMMFQSISVRSALAMKRLVGNGKKQYLRKVRSTNCGKTSQALALSLTGRNLSPYGNKETMLQLERQAMSASNL